LPASGLDVSTKLGAMSFEPRRSAPSRERVFLRRAELDHVVGHAYGATRSALFFAAFVTVLVTYRSLVRPAREAEVADVDVFVAADRPSAGPMRRIAIDRSDLAAIAVRAATATGLRALRVRRPPTRVGERALQVADVSRARAASSRARASPPGEEIRQHYRQLARCRDLSFSPRRPAARRRAVDALRHRTRQRVLRRERARCPPRNASIVNPLGHVHEVRTSSRAAARARRGRQPTRGAP